jgi:phosphatidate phosphatase
VEPYKRGFFCDDESLKLPQKELTIANCVLYVVGFAVPILAIFFTEFALRKSDEYADRELVFFGRKIPYWSKNLYKFFGIFLFGVACNQLAAEIGKHTIGRFRPHFIQACQPILPDGSTCSDAKNLRRYIEDFTCENNDNNELRLSFPSAHSSFAMYTMLFAALFVHFRMNWKGLKFVKHFLQLVFMMLAWFLVLSRISDYHHHCELLNYKNT